LLKIYHKFQGISQGILMIDRDRQINYFLKKPKVILNGLEKIGPERFPQFYTEHFF
jgi:hypothetical protein